MNGRTLIPYLGRIYIALEGMYEAVTVVSNIVSEVSKSLSDFDNSDWIEYKGKHYCPDCYDFDEEKDENIPLPAYPKSIFKVEKFLKTYVGFKDAITKEYSEHFIVSVHLRTNEQLQKEFLEMIRSILALESWSFEVIPAEKYSNSTLVIKIEKQYKKS